MALPDNKGIETENAELLTTREFQRDYSQSLDRVESGEVEKLVLTRHGKMRAVVISVETYRRLMQIKKAFTPSAIAADIDAYADSDD